MGRRTFILFVSLICLLVLCFAGQSYSAQSERILDFKSRIHVHRNGGMTVTETITVVCAQRVIKRGIVREFPTKYKDTHGNTMRVGFRITSILRDGQPESYHIKEASNGKKVYIGRKDRFLRPGTYTYSITYKTDRQLGFFKDFDELYWNVTGNGWTFAIDNVEAVVDLPPGAKILKKAAYTGHFGAKGGDFTTGFDEKGSITFTTTRGLRPKEGLSIAVAWPKGIVIEPTFQDRAGYFLRDNFGVFAALVGLFLLCAYYFAVWLMVGRDPAKGTVFPLFYPPKGFSPAAVRFVMRMGFDNKSFAAAVVDLAVKGALTIIQDDEKVYTLKKAGDTDAGLSKGEQKILRKLFGSTSSIELKNKNHQKIQGTISALKKSLKIDFEKIYFFRNSKYFIPGLLITILTLGAVVLTSRELMAAAFMTLWLSIWTAGCFFLVVRAISAWKSGLGWGGFIALRSAGALAASIFALPFLAGEAFGIWAFSTFVSPLAAVFILVIILINALFYHLLKAPTLSGRKTMDEIEGFKLYLSAAEKERLEILNPPDRTPKLFEKYLPYAMALDVENQWNKQFADVLSAATANGQYTPVWYNGSHFGAQGLNGMASGLGTSLTGAISSASSAPGSSSGSGGGGSSGGGGGGGGGSGW